MELMHLLSLTNTKKHIMLVQVNMNTYILLPFIENLILHMYPLHYMCRLRAPS